MGNVKVNCSWWDKYDLFVDVDQNIEVFVDSFPQSEIPQNTIRFILIQEPFVELKNRMVNLFRNYKNKYNYILTYHQDILNEFENAHLFMGAVTWVHDYKYPIKEFSISTVVGNKSSNTLEGYQLRKDVFFNEDKISNPTKFYLSSRSKLNINSDLILGDKKEPLFDSMFSIVIENTSIDNMFTEKLLDCFTTKTIPIYYGCKNIGEFFDIDGILVVNNIDDIINISNSVNENLYHSKTTSIDKNYDLSLTYSPWEKNLEKTLRNILLKN